MGWTDQRIDNSCSRAVLSVCVHVSKRKADTLNRVIQFSVGQQLLGIMNNFQPLPAFMLIFIAMVIRFCVDLIELILVLVIAHRKRVV